MHGLELYRGNRLIACWAVGDPQIGEDRTRVLRPLQSRELLLKVGAVTPHLRQAIVRSLDAAASLLPSNDQGRAFLAEFGYSSAERLRNSAISAARDHLLTILAKQDQTSVKP